MVLTKSLSIVSKQVLFSKILSCNELNVTITLSCGLLSSNGIERARENIDPKIFDGVI